MPQPLTGSSRQCTHSDGQVRLKPNSPSVTRAVSEWRRGHALSVEPRRANSMKPEFNTTLVAQAIAIRRADEQRGYPSVVVALDTAHYKAVLSPTLHLEPVTRSLSRMVARCVCRVCENAERGKSA